MDTPMMTTARKSFLVSLAFHALMGSLAFFALTQMRTPPPMMMKISPKHMMVVSLSPATPTPKQPQISKPIATPQQPITKQLLMQPIIPAKSAPQSVQAISTPITPPTPLISSPAIQQPIQSLQAPAMAPSKPKTDTTSEKRAFFNSLRATIQNHLHYPSAARRRGMEGEIDVRFTLANDGTINAISVQKGETIFHNAVKTAVSSASGIDIPKNLTDSLPMEIELTLEFKLNS
jgi:periplasmic protein TonB